MTISMDNIEKGGGGGDLAILVSGEYWTGGGGQLGSR